MLAQIDRAVIERSRKDLGEFSELLDVGKAATTAGLMKELEVKERLDAMIDKCLKRLLFVRGLKSISIDAKGTPPALITAQPDAGLPQPKVVTSDCALGNATTADGGEAPSLSPAEQDPVED